ncbi:hypothetical protein H5410_044777 [Solanum commersonii]|uniref:Secreted protein n=1 Tax=Solanum commersonii TaxID=4109 RepID=A0A9J5X9K0_SOLCO|nr:hypothetical protein H5410_044777 [Solanum commersonii]
MTRLVICGFAVLAFVRGLCICDLCFSEDRRKSKIGHLGIKKALQQAFCNWRKLYYQLCSSSKESSTEFFPEIDLKRRSAFRRSRRSTTSQGVDFQRLRKFVANRD